MELCGRRVSSRPEYNKIGTDVPSKDLLYAVGPMAGETAIAEKQMLPLHTAGYNGGLDPHFMGSKSEARKAGNGLQVDDEPYGFKLLP
jgi:hypothetical protein